MSCRQFIKMMLLSSCLCQMSQSCIYEYDSCPVASFKIVNDWSKAPDADPDGMAYFSSYLKGENHGAMICRAGTVGSLNCPTISIISCVTIMTPTL